MACLKENTVKKWTSYNDLTWLEHKLGGSKVGVQAQASQQRLGVEAVERLGCSVSRSLYWLHIKSANQINISANQIEN